MNLPNKLTLLRVLMIPVFCVFLHFSPDSTLWRWLSLCVFALACLTDWLDGQIARRRNLVTNFGKFMDPIADKLLTVTAFIVMVDLERMSAWMCVVFVAREFVVSGLRLVAVEQRRCTAGAWPGSAPPPGGRRGRCGCCCRWGRRRRGRWPPRR